MIALDDAILWPASKVGEALQALAQKCGLSSGKAEIPTLSGGALGSDEALGRWIEATARLVGVEAEPTASDFAGIERLLEGSAPALFRMPAATGVPPAIRTGEPLFLAVLRTRRGRVSVLGPDLDVHTVSLAAIRSALCRHIEDPLAEPFDRILREIGIPERRRPRVRAALVRERLRHHRMEGCWLLRLPPGASLPQAIGNDGLWRTLFAFAGGHVVFVALWMLSWWMVGRGVLQGRLDSGWMLAWSLVLLTMVPVRLLVASSEGLLALGVGTLVKRRLLDGALRLDPDVVRHHGVGQLLGRTIESNTMEQLALNGGFLVLTSAIELALSAVVLAAGAGGGFHAILLLGWLALTALVGARFYAHRQAWTEARLDMTHDLVEQMVGHRTRQVQESPDRTHDHEDQSLARYESLSKRLDRSNATLMVLPSRGWLLVGLAGLFPAFAAGTSAATGLAVAVGGVLSAYIALRKLAGGFTHLSVALLAWQRLKPLMPAEERFDATSSSASLVLANGGVTERRPVDAPLPTLLDARDIVFRYRPRSEPVLRGCHLRIREGDRLLLEGSSGGGKSTFAAILAGMRVPESGLLRLHGLDRPTLGFEGWRRGIASAPQFHQNHVFTETFAFNLLMGRRWPPEAKDLEECDTLCRELGLGDLLDRMPAGMMQMVGESGWQLSHGERSRLYLARALLQGADVILLDESFGALDPESLRKALRCVLARAPALVVIAHP